MKVYVIQDTINYDESYSEDCFEETEILGVALSEEKAKNFIINYDDFGIMFEDKYSYEDDGYSFARYVLEKDDHNYFWRHQISYSEIETIE